MDRPHFSRRPRRGSDVSQFIHGLAEANVELNRKALSNMAIEDPVAFKAIVTRSKEALSAAASAK